MRYGPTPGSAAGRVAATSPHWASAHGRSPAPRFRARRRGVLYSGGKGSAATWIFTIARNLRIDRLRREMPFQKLPEADAAESATDEAPPDEVVSQRERQVRVQAVLAALPADQRETVVLAYIDGLSHSDIARRLGVPLGTVKSRMRLAYSRIREALGDLR